MHEALPLDRPNAPPEGLILFARAADAERLVAGIPAAARAVLAAEAAGLAGCAVAVPGGWAPSLVIREEIARLTPDMPVRYIAAEEAGPTVALAIDGARLPAAEALAAVIAGTPDTAAVLAGGDAIDGFIARVQRDAADAPGLLEAASRAALLATAKPGDGIVSRTLNRPVSQAISGLLLRVRGVRPIHATCGTALIALAMFAALLGGTRGGLVAGALLFHAASVFDGVDGEISRATLRTSRRGAMLDSLVDAATNLAFLLGVAVNLGRQGDSTGALLGFTGLVLVAIGLTLIGRASARSGQPFGFEIVKEYYRARSCKPSASRAAPAALPRSATFQSRSVTFLTLITSRDFFALAFAVMLVAGLADAMMGIFAVSATLWLMAVGFALLPRKA